MGIIATFPEGVTKVYTKTAYQHDKGQYLTFEGIDVNTKKEAHVSNFEEGGISAAVKINDGMILIPDAFFESGDYIYVWIYARNIYGGGYRGIGYHMDSDDPEYDHMVIDSAGGGSISFENAETLYEVVIPIIRRPSILRVDSPGTENDGESGSVFDNYTVDGENLILR